MISIQAVLSTLNSLLDLPVRHNPQFSTCLEQVCRGLGFRGEKSVFSLKFCTVNIFKARMQLHANREGNFNLLDPPVALPIMFSRQEITMCVRDAVTQRELNAEKEKSLRVEMAKFAEIEQTCKLLESDLARERERCAVLNQRLSATLDDCSQLANRCEKLAKYEQDCAWLQQRLEKCRSPQKKFQKE